MPRTAAERAAAAERRIKVSGGRVLRIHLSPVVARHAKALTAASGETFRAMVERAIMALPVPPAA